MFRSPTSTSPSQSKSFQYEDDAEKSARQEENEYENDEYME